MNSGGCVLPSQRFAAFDLTSGVGRLQIRGC